MILYHYRSVESALKELDNCTFHFATRAELNDPMEGYLRVFWQGDKAAWEGMFRNYICSLNQAMDLYLLQGDENLLHHRSLIGDLHQFDHIPLGEIFQKIGDRFLEDEDIQKIVSFYGNPELGVYEKELCFILRIVHGKAMRICIQENRERRLIPEKEADNLIKFFADEKGVSAFLSRLNSDQPGSADWSEMLKQAEGILEDAAELRYISCGLEDESFLYGIRRDENGKPQEEDLKSSGRGRRNWLAVAFDFPQIYVEQLREMIYPESYVACFSGKNDDSAMWGNYADNHRGVCLVYETDDDDSIKVKGEQSVSLKVKPVQYGGGEIERNFFESFGRLNRRQIKTWLTGTEGLSSCYEAFNDENEWRGRYWSAYEAKTYRKFKAWEHENEYRITVDNTFGEYERPEDRNLKYNPQNLKGIIFGIKTAEYDKLRIMKSLLAHADEYGDFKFYQAEYDDKGQTIVIRRKGIWRLK